MWTVPPLITECPLDFLLINRWACKDGLTWAPVTLSPGRNDPEDSDQGLASLPAVSIQGLVAGNLPIGSEAESTRPHPCHMGRLIMSPPLPQKKALEIVYLKSLHALSPLPSKTKSVMENLIPSLEF